MSKAFPILASPAFDNASASTEDAAGGQRALAAIEIGAFLLISAPATEALDLRATAVTRGYLPLNQSPRHAAVFVRGSRLHVSEADGNFAVVIGQTTSPSPARTLLDAWDFHRSAPKDPFALVGHFAALVVYGDRVHLMTDHVGSLSIHETVCRSSRVRVLGTDLGDVSLVSSQTRLDPVSVREFVLRGAVTSPHTIRESIERIPPSAIVSISPELSRPTTLHYWTPAVPAQVSTPTVIADAAQRGREIMATNLDAVLHSAERALLFYSGGEDCRVLGALCRRGSGSLSKVRATIFLDHRNREYRLARWSSRLLGLQLDIRFRTASHYVDSISEAVKLTGGGVDLIHNHAMGLVDPTEADLFIDGWTADSFLKGWALEHELATRISPIQESVAGDEIDAAIAERRRRRLTILQDLRGAEDGPSWMSLWPISDHLDYGNLGINLRARPSISPYMFGNFVDAILPVNERQKFQRGLFWPMFGGIMGLAGWIPRSGGEIPAVSPKRSRIPTRIFQRLFRTEDSLLRRFGRYRAQGPWQSGALWDKPLAEAEHRIGADRLEVVRSMVGVTGEKSLYEQSHAPRHRILQVAMIDG